MMISVWKMGAITVLMLSSLLFSVQAVDDISAQTGTLASPDVSIELDQNEIWISLEPGNRDDGVTITGDLYCDIPEGIPDGIDCKVYLIPRMEFSVIEGETVFIFTKEVNRQDISFHVDIPEEYSGNDLFFSLEGSWQYENGRGRGEITSRWCNIRIKDFGAIEIYMLNDQPYTVEAEPGDQIELWLVVKNTGTTDDRVTLEFLTEDPEIRIEIDNETVTVKIGQTRKEPFTLMVGEDFTGESGFTVNAMSEVPGLRSTDSMEVTVKVNEEEDGNDQLFIIITAVIIVIIIFFLALIAFRLRSD